MFPEFLPPLAQTLAQSLVETTSIELVKNIQQVPITTSLNPQPILSSYTRQGAGESPLLLIHGFDSSVLEFRRLVPLLAPFRETWALDLLGFGFTDRTQGIPITPQAIKTHLYFFWKTMIARPMVLVGASMGGAAAIDFALTYPEVVEKLILLDSAGFAKGPAMGKLMVPPLDRWAAGFLKNPAVRDRISRQAYHDPSFASPDALTCAALHLQDPAWVRSTISFAKSGGYNFLSEAQIRQISQPTLIVWGDRDRILGVQDAQKFKATIPNSQLVWMQNCGHVPHLEKPQETAQEFLSWL